MAIGNAAGKHIVTVEGTNLQGLNFIQQSFAEEGATQCGFCTPGFMVSLAGYVLSGKDATPAAAIDAVNGNICRCTGYKSIERATSRIAGKLSERGQQDTLAFAVEQGMLPEYFLHIKERLQQLNQPPPGATRPEGLQRKYLGGGTDLYVQQHDTMHHEEIDFLFDKSELQGVYQSGTRCYIGAAATVTDLAESAVMQMYFPGMNDYVKLVSSTPIRNMATIAGNLVNASPIGDFTIFLLALNAQLLLREDEHTRELPLNGFYKGYKKLAKSHDEIIEKISFELPDKNTRFNFEKICKRTHLDIASVNSAMSVRMEGDIIKYAHLSAGGVGPVPAYLQQASAFLAGKEMHPETVDKLVHTALEEVSPITDARGTADYKRFLLGQLIRAHCLRLFPALKPVSILPLT
jgi:xanthine dehydrogenase small subunit